MKSASEWVRVGAKGLVYVSAVIMCCISSDASFFHARWPLIASVTEPMARVEK
jgi:hypothetical protein